MRRLHRQWRPSVRARLVLLFTVAAVGVGIGFGLVLTRRLELGLRSDLDTVMRQRAAEVVAEIGNEIDNAPGAADLSAAEGPVQVLSADGSVLAAAGGASSRVPLVSPGQQRRGRSGVFIVDRVVLLGHHRERARVLVAPVSGVGQHGDQVALAVNRDPVDDVVERGLLELAVLGTPATLVVAAGLWLVTGAALRPVERMRAQAAAAVPGQGTVLSVPRGGDEFSRLAMTLNDLIAAQEAALRAERSFLADAGHELRTPLAILAGELELADRPHRTRQELVETITVARQETARLVRLAEQLLVLARMEGAGLRRARVDAAEVADLAITAWAPGAATSAVELRRQGPEPVIAHVDPVQMRQVLDNLLSNALRVAPPGSAVDVDVQPLASDGVVIAVHDGGPGFPADFVHRAFDRFTRADVARTREAALSTPDAPSVPQAASGAGVEPGLPPLVGDGTGLGLAVVAGIAQAHGGTAAAQGGPGGGAVVTVTLPGPAQAP